MAESSNNDGQKMAESSNNDGQKMAESSNNDGQKMAESSTSNDGQSYFGHLLCGFHKLINHFTTFKRKSKSNMDESSKDKPGKIGSVLRCSGMLLKRIYLKSKELVTTSSRSKKCAVVIPILIAILAFLLFNLSFSQFLTTWCSTTLPQDVSKFSPCYLVRSRSLKNQQHTYAIKSPTKSMPFARLDKSILVFFPFIVTKPFLREHAFNWLWQTFYHKKVTQDYTKLARRLPQNMTMSDFDYISQNFHLHPDKRLEEFVQLPSLEEPFHLEKRDWISDKLFAEQRLAGVNPMSLKKITFSDEIGTNWKRLKTMLNDTFSWNNAVLNVMDGISLDTAIDDGRLFVLHHHCCDGLKTPQNKENRDPHRKMWKHMSPIALFASVPGKKSLSKPRLMPVAIQMDYQPDSPVLSPSDGYLWTLAKLNVQLADLECSQIVEHLCKVHLVSEGLCLSVERQLSVNHPLYAIMRYHCRGVFAANTFGAPVLLEPDKELDHLFPYGADGATELVRSTFLSYEWKDLHFKKNIKQRGVDDHRHLPYYPYRDDGAVIHDVIKSTISDYVDAYYGTDTEVEDDIEVQNYANEISDKGMLPGAAQIRIRGFPASIDSKQQLVDTFTQMIWLMSAQHSAVGYPLADYALHVPNMPCKLYHSPNVPNKTYSAERLPNRTETTDQAAFAMSLASYRHDRLFDYHEKLDDVKAKAVLGRHFINLYDVIQPRLKRRNEKRLAAGHLTYPYMLPRWLPNGIQT